MSRVSGFGSCIRWIISLRGRPPDTFKGLYNVKRCTRITLEAMPQGAGKREQHSTMHELPCSDVLIRPQSAGR